MTQPRCGSAPGTATCRQLAARGRRAARLVPSCRVTREKGAADRGSPRAALGRRQGSGHTHRLTDEAAAGPHAPRRQNLREAAGAETAHAAPALDGQKRKNSTFFKNRVDFYMAKHNLLFMKKQYLRSHFFRPYVLQESS